MSASAPLPFVSVVIPVRDGEQTVRACLAAVLSSDYPSGRREIVVVDNGSADATAEIVRTFPVRYVAEERPGHSSARNRGIEASAGDVIAFTDADCLVTTSWLRELVAGLEHEVAAVAGDTVAFPPATRAERYTALRRPSFMSWSAHGGPQWFQFTNAAVKRETFDRVGRFDPRIRGGCEDVDFAWRLQEAALVTRRQPRAIVFHRHRTSGRQLFAQHRGYGRGQAALARKYPQAVEWGLRRELLAWQDLAATALLAAGASFGRGRAATASARDRYPSLDLARKIGQRLGFLEGLVLERMRG